LCSSTATAATGIETAPRTMTRPAATVATLAHVGNAMNRLTTCTVDALFTKP